MTFLFGKAEKVEEGFDWDDRFIPRFIRDENKENLEHEWKEIYGFYIDIMNNPQTNGMFNEGRDIKTDKKNVILNNGVKEIDFKPKNKTRSNEIVDKISAEDLINFVYCKNV